MKKIIFLFVLFLSVFMSSCNHSSEMADDIIGEWETVHLREKGSYDGYSYDESYDITPEIIDEWYIMSITNTNMKLIQTNDVEGGASILNIPFPYTFKDDKLTSLLLDSDNTRTVTVSFPDDDTMVFYMDDSGYTDGIYEVYESWMTYHRVK